MKNEITPQEDTYDPVVLACDLDEYREELSSFNLSQQQEDELLQTLWQIMSTMVDIGFGVDNVQLVLPELFNQESEPDANNNPQ